MKKNSMKIPPLSKLYEQKNDFTVIIDVGWCCEPEMLHRHNVVFKRIQQTINRAFGNFIFRLGVNLGVFGRSGKHRRDTVKA